ncbi:MAG: hypothetical protein IJ467_05500 [Bacteroidaceae bacterium]|nr:hypothetical protein [Bacteroidaceae bacterium]
MYKKVFSNVSLQVLMQQQTEVTDQPICLAGVLSKNQNEFRFEQSVKIKRPRRNPKLYEGQYVSLVHRSDDKYACTLKHITTKDKDFDYHNVAFRIYLELIDALQIIR